MYWHFMSRILCCLLTIPETLLRRTISDYQVVSYSLLHNLQIQNHIPVFECTLSHIGYCHNIDNISGMQNKDRFWKISWIWCSGISCYIYLFKVKLQGDHKKGYKVELCYTAIEYISGSNSALKSLPSEGHFII